MEFLSEVVAVVIGFMVIANRLVAGIITPIFDKYELDKFWILYIAWSIAGVLVFVADVNLFEPFIADLLFGKILTALIAGGGSNMLHDLTDK